jgi:hypothetical protein
MAIATCGHEVEDGVLCWVFDANGNLFHSVCCPDCVIGYYRSGELADTDISQLISKIIKGDWKE